VNNRVLLVDDAPGLLESFEKLLGRDYALITASGPVEGLKKVMEEGPFAVVISDYDMPVMGGAEFLQRVREQSPDSIRIMLTAFSAVDVAVKALHEGRVFRFLEKPCSVEHLRLALDAALEQHQIVASQRQAAEELQFSKDALTHFTETLDGRIEEQTQHLVRLHQYAQDLNSAESLEAIAELTAAAARDILGERGVFVELVESLPASRRFHATTGPTLSEERTIQEVATSEGCLGSITLSARDARLRELTRLERDLLSSIASSAAVASRNQIRRQERDEAQHHTILAMAKLAERRDNETGQHLERVSRFCQLIAEGLREDGHCAGIISDEWIRDLYRSAPLHDIGKVGIPDNILLKPGRLDQDEWQVMKQHTTIGAETLRSVMAVSRSQGFLELGLEIAWCHHEKWDATGYPRGLSGEGIPLSARILALADVYDALTSPRPYKDPWPHEESIEWIRFGSGTHFDPSVVQAFLLREEQADAIREGLADAASEAPLGCRGDEGDGNRTAAYDRPR